MLQRTRASSLLSVDAKPLTSTGAAFDEVTSRIVTLDEATEPTPAPIRDRAVLTVLSGLDAGRCFAIDEDVTLIGRERGSAVQIEDAGVSRRHALLRRDVSSFVVEDLGAKNGTFVDGARITRAELRSGSWLQVGPNVRLRFGMLDRSEESLERALYDASVRDPLTGLHNPRYFFARLNAEAAYARRNGVGVGVLVIDVDDFKRVNDTLGHAAGDAVLAALARRFEQVVRVEDVVARLGGDEFAILVRGSSREQLATLGERIRRTIAGVAIPWGRTELKVTISVGGATLEECNEEHEALAVMAVADRDLYRAKVSGRNRVGVGS